ncbi:hypothetical protein SD10_26895 [Spirosoma radiotolerans]|uniref:Uncharacterized protein n=1 Tax=Spirosoma radiotolerans TaxID=1379870 RepID=A0A0E4A076_9BACT|nr:hypothetical protein SD10_26895 [Spirosoma radiotolerans]
MCEVDCKNQSFVQKKGLKSGYYDDLAVNVYTDTNVKAGQSHLIGKQLTGFIYLKRFFKPV